MKRFTSVAAAATLSLSLVAGPAFAAEAQPSDKDAKVGSSVAVSYTHLTLPTICSV